jgi:hypothetical protein
MRNIKHEKNPFLGNLEIKTKKKTIKVNSSIGKDNNVVINQGTGEVVGEYTHVTTYREVDETEFVKIFTSNIAMTFDLTSAGIKAFNVLMYAVQNQAINKDQVFLDEKTLINFLEQTAFKKALSLKTLYRGINELIKSQIIAKATRYGVYFINPNFVFNGDRIAFTTGIIKKRSKEIQQELNLEN